MISNSLKSILNQSNFTLNDSIKIYPTTTLNDQNRIGKTICLCPNPSISLAAICDSLDCVVLFDTDDDTIVWMFKGYPNVQIGWLQHIENLSTFIVLLTDQGTLELHKVPYGPRISCIDVGCDCVLIQPFFDADQIPFFLYLSTKNGLKQITLA